MTSMQSHRLLVDETGNNITSPEIQPQGVQEEIVVVFIQIGAGGGTVNGRIQVQGRPGEDTASHWDNLGGSNGIPIDQAGVNAWIATFQKFPRMRLRIVAKTTDHPINGWIVE